MRFENPPRVSLPSTAGLYVRALLQKIYCNIERPMAMWHWIVREVLQRYNRATFFRKGDRATFTPLVFLFVSSASPPRLRIAQ